MAEEFDFDDFDENDMAWKATPEAERKRLFDLAHAEALAERAEEEAKKQAGNETPKPTTDEATP